MDTNMVSVEEHPLSAYQKDIWLEQCMYPDKPIYNLGGYIEVKGEMDPSIFNASIRLLIRQNDSLRARLVDRQGEPYLAIRPEVDYTVPFHDFSQRDKPNRACVEWMKREFLKPIQSEPQFFEFVLLKGDANTYYILLKVYHMVIDGWGFALLFGQMFENYNTLAQGGHIDRTCYAYTDFIADNRQYLDSAVFAKDREFWKSRFETLPEPLLSRGMDGEDDAESDALWSDRLILTIPKDIYNGMIEFCEEEGCSSFHYFLGLLFVYFSRVCQRSEMVIGVPVFNRGHARYKQTLGHFANVLPLRISPGQDLTFKELMKLIKRELMQCYRHQKISFGEIYRAVYENVNDKGNLFDISLSFEEQEMRHKFDHAECRSVSMTHHHERNALTLLIWGHEGAADVTVNFDYRIKAFEKFISIEKVISHFNHLFKQAMEQPETPLSQLEILPEDERDALLRDFNRTEAEYAREQTIHGMFERQAELRPDHPALVFGETELTYRELNQRADRLADQLRAQGVQRDGIVALMAERSPDMVIGMLGTLKAGGAYLPVDPNYPGDRIRYMLEDSGAGVLLTQSHLRDKLAGTYGGRIIELDREAVGEVVTDNGAGDMGTPKKTVGRPDDLAYIIYTSGSTGKPKGVMVEHQGVVNLQHFFAEQWGVGERERMLQFASSSFDASVWEAFTVLLGGGTLVLVAREIINDLHEFERYINEHKVTIALLPPTYLAGLAPGRLPALKKLVTGGSAITKELAARWKDRVEYMNAYGPSEYSVIATTWTYHEEEARSAFSIPIGRPIGNTRIYILDAHQKLLPAGAAGELCIAGDGLARGYLHRPELTSEKFVESPFAAGERLYRTGDLARWLPDGNLEYLGRIDDQVKIRGFRIELGEIETRLQEHPAVREAVVIARTDRAGEKYLAAYFTAPAEGSLDTERLREHLLQGLPDYMVPAYWIQLDAMPLTPNAKIDKKALPEPDLNARTGAEYAAPRSRAEDILAEVWAKVLKVERVGIKDNFLSLGGDSIKAIQIISQLHGHKLKLQLKDLFDHPVIEQLSAYVQSVERIADQSTVTGSIQPTPIQSWLFEQPFAAKHHFNQAVLLHRREGFDEQLLRNVLNRLAEHHDALRIVVREQAGEPLLFNRGIHDDGELYSLEVRDFTGTSLVAEAVEDAADRLQTGFDLRQGPLFKAGLYRTIEGDYLALCIHHLAIDGVSWRILFEDLASGYRQAETGEAIRFRDKTDSFRAWSEALQTYAASANLQDEIAYWRELEQMEILPIPKNHPVEARRVGDLDYFDAELNETETAKLLKDANRAYNTEINDILLTALGEAIQGWTGESQALINLEGHGREEILPELDVSRTVGWFTAQYPVVLDLGGSEDAGDRLKAVKESLRRIPRKGIGYGILKYRRFVREEGLLRFRLQPEISFNYLGQFDEEPVAGVFALSGLSTGAAVSPDMPSPYVLDIVGRVTGGKLQLRFAYHQGELEAVTLHRVAEGFKRSLLRIIDHCASRGYAELTASDVSSKRVTSAEVDGVYRAMGSLAPEIADIYSLTPMQLGMLYHSLREPASAAYFEQAFLELEGRIDPNLFDRAFRLIVQRHDILRTAFVHEKVRQPVQVVLRNRPANIFHADICGLAETEREAYLSAYAAEDKERGFDLLRDPLIRVALIQTSTDTCRLIWSFHHIVMDGWCLGIVFKELLEGYRALREGSEPRVSPVRPFSDYTQWLESREDQESTTYWDEYLAEYEQPALLPKCRSEADDRAYAQEEYDFSIDADEKAGLEELARANRATLSTVLQAIWGIVLQRYNNTRDVVFGTVVSGRPAELPGVEEMVGLFINTVPVRVRAGKEMSFSSLVTGLQEEALASEPHHYDLLADIQSRTALGANLVQTLVAIENYPLEEAVKSQETRGSASLSDVENDGGGGIRLLSARVSEQTSFDFNLIVVPEAGLKIKFRYNRRVYDQGLMERVAGQLRLIVSQVIARPDILIGELEIVSGEERRQQLHDFNRTEAAYAREQTIHGMFERQAELRPDHPALVFGDEALTYRDLNERADRLAQALRAQGVQRDGIVALMTERSPEMVVGMLGTLKAGGAYLPVDPNYPEDRIQYMLEDSGAAVLLTQRHLRDKLSGAYGGRVIELDRGGAGEVVADNGAGDMGTPKKSVGRPDDLAYIIYTSGSTGKPKGVMVEHRGVINLQHCFAERWGVGQQDRMLQFASHSFDASVWEAFTILLGGGTLVLASRAIINDINKFEKYIDDNGISIALLPPTYLAGLAPGRLPALKKLVTGGSAITKELAARWKDHAEYMNAYGPSEYSVIATTWNYHEEEVRSASSVPIGRPIDNTRIYILDAHLKLLPFGAAGELCIAGDGLARGYLHRPELTSEKFVESPFIAGERMYRTGDLARWLPDGNLEYLGRIDDQVKIRGFRIELGEIESRLQEHPAVREAVVIARTDRQGEKYLAAYYTAEAAEAEAQAQAWTGAEADSVREYLLRELPEYMVPAFVSLLDAMPLTPNGKIDKKALPEPERRIAGGLGVSLPRTEAERKIRQVWQELLDMEPIGIDDDFFRLGGNSIKAIQVVSRLALDFEVGINDLFQYPTIRALAEHIRYSKDRLKEVIRAMQEAAASREQGGSALDSPARDALRDYRERNRRYDDLDFGAKAGYRHILLAGATGYLGIHILHRLLQSTDYAIHVPVRGNSDREARERVLAKLEFHFGDAFAGREAWLEDRLHVYSGDLTQDRLGLSPERYSELADIVDAVINSAANVKHFGHYAEFHAVNVEGNERLIEFVRTGKPKAYNFISTTSVGSGWVEGAGSLVFTEYDCNVGQSSDNYYVMTKLEAEKRIAEAREQGITANVFRVGNLVFDSRSGIFQENIGDNAFYALVKSLIKLGRFPAIRDKTLNFSFVDQVAEAVVLLFDRMHLQDETYHLFNGYQVNLLAFARLLGEAGVSVDTMPVEAFAGYMLDRYDEPEAQEEVTRILVHSNVFFEGASKTLFLVQNRKTDRLLQALGFKWSRLDRRKVELMLEHCRRVGFMEAGQREERKHS
ncbi:amino acid adenylation domain-containing protein [Paenibacillus macerans]|uniref:non-ribosomal peptide synthetase n=1 Tax=Paenibacillus macerans TaxID=44252 RepID=UPI003D32199E